jgi:2-phosphosulfolactate phosphatase
MKKPRMQNLIQKRVPLSLETSPKDIVKAVNRGDVLVVIDVLRCCSTIVTALAHGAKAVIPKDTVRDAKAHHKKHPESLLAGERRGVKPRGFDMGNSPLEFSPNTVRERQIVLTTTNGTKAICLSKNSKWTLIGAFLNAKAVAEMAFSIAQRETVGVSFVLSGTHGRFSLEDFICAGAIVEKLPTNRIDCSDAVMAAVLAFQQSQEWLTRIIHRGSHAQYLEDIGHEEDVKFCCRLNAYPVVPVYKPEGIVLFSLDEEIGGS